MSVSLFFLIIVYFQYTKMRQNWTTTYIQSRRVLFFSAREKEPNKTLHLMQAMLTINYDLWHGYRKIPKISPGAYIFQRPFFGGAYIRRGLCTEGNLRLKIDWASLLLGRKFSVFLCFTLYLTEISKYKPPWGAYIFWRGNLTEGFLHYEFGGLIFGGAYTWMGLFSEFYGSSCQKRAQTVIILFLFFRPMKLLSL